MRRLAIALLIAIYATPSSAQELSWPTFRHDQDRTGRSTGHGAITNPTVTWTYDLGGKLDTYDVWIGNLNGDAQKEIALVESGRVILKNASDLVIWVSPNIGVTGIVGAFDFDGDGNIELLAVSDGPPAALNILERDTGTLLWRYDDFEEGANSIYSAQVLVADITSDGLPEIVCSARFNDQPTHAFSFASGFLTDPSSNEIWYYINEVYSQDVFYLASDVNLDDQSEIVFFENQQITVLDGTTGTPLIAATGVFRSYSLGHMQVLNIDSDPQPEIISIGSSRYNHTVTVYDAIDGSVTWQYQWDPSGLRSVAYTGDSVVDLDGDGSLEIVVSVFNDTDDEYTGNTSTPADHDGINYPNHWSLIVFDAATGSVEAVLPDAYLRAIIKPDPSAAPLVLAQSAPLSSSTLPAMGTLTAYTLSTSSLTPSWSIPDSSILTVAAAQDPSYTFYSHIASQDLNLDGINDILIHRDIDLDSQPDILQAVSVASSTPSILASLALHKYESTSVLALGDDLSASGRTLETCVFRSTGRIEILSPSFSIRASLDAGHFSLSPIVADISGDDSNDVAVGTSTNEIQILDPSTAPPSILWGYYGAAEPILTTADVDGDHVYELAVLDANIITDPTIHLLDSSGSSTWSNVLTGYGSIPTRIVFGNINGDTSVDIITLVTDVREGAATDLKLVGISGSTGETLWESSTSSNGIVQTSIHPVTDGSSWNDSIIVVDHQKIEEYDQADGSLLHSTNCLSFSRATMLSDFDGDSDDELLLISHYHSQGIQFREIGADSYMTTIPFEYDGQLYPRYPAIFSSTGESYGFIQPYPEGKLIAYRGDGSLLWGPIWIRTGTLATTNPGGGNSILYASVADIDGDGHEDVLAGTADGFLSAIRISDAALVWSIPLYASVYEPIFADIDDDGLLEILVVTGNGTLHAIDQQYLDAPAEVRDVALSDYLEITDPATDIDETEVRIALGAAWEPVTGATGYRVMAIDSEGIQITPWQDAGSATSSLVLSTAPLPLDATYYVVVIAYGDSGRTSPETRSDGVFLTDVSAPTIDLFTAEPSVFNPYISSTHLRLQAHDSTWIASWEIRLTDATDTTTIFWQGEPFSTFLDLSQPWDGLDSHDLTVSDGTYTARATVTDLAGHVASVSCDIVVDSSMSEIQPESPPDELPDDYSIYYARGGGCSCSLVK